MSFQSLLYHAFGLECQLPTKLGKQRDMIEDALESHSTSMQDEGFHTQSQTQDIRDIRHIPFQSNSEKKRATSRSDAAHGKVGLGLPVYLLTAANCRSDFLPVSAAARASS